MSSTIPAVDCGFLQAQGECVLHVLALSPRGPNALGHCVLPGWWGCLPHMSTLLTPTPALPLFI